MKAEDEAGRIVRKIVQRENSSFGMRNDGASILIDFAKKYHQSKLQALKEEIRKECLYQGMNPNEAHGVRNVLNLITNLEDKQPNI